MSESAWHADDKVWAKIRPPMVPVEEDIHLIQHACPPHLLAPDATPRILILGVTPALVNASWPAGAEIHAVDYDEMMIEMFWREVPGKHIHCARWQHMPFADGYFDFVVGDCSFNAMPAIAEYGEVLAEIRRVSKPRAALACRFFMRPAPQPTFEDLIERSKSVNTVSVRLLMAMAAADIDGTVRFLDIPRLVEERWGDFEAYLSRIGHDADEIARTKAVVSSGQQLNYPTEAQIRREFERHYPTIEFTPPSYEIGECCPTVRFS